MFLVHFVIAAAIAYGAEVVPSAAWGYAALLAFCSMCLGLLKYSPATFLLMVPLLALRITEFISGAAIESGAYMIETTTLGQPTGAFARLLLIYLAFFLVATITVEASWPKLRLAFRDAPARWEKQAPLIWLGLVVVAIVCTVYLVRLGINNGFPLFNHIDRFAYLEKVNSPIYTAFIRNRLVAVPFVGVLVALPNYRRRGIYMLLWMLLTSIVFGEKFGSLLMILSVLAIPAGLVHIANDRPIPLKPIAMTSTAIVCFTIPAVLVAYGALEDFDKATKRYGQRVALQGQLWYVTDQRYLGLTQLDGQAIGADIASWMRPSQQNATIAGTRFGLYYVMQRFTPSRTLGWTMEGGNGFVFSLYPYLLMATGIGGLLIISSIIAIYHALLMRLLALSMAGSNWIAGLLFGRVLSSIYATYSTGFLWNMFGIKTLVTLIAGMLLMWEFGRRASISRQFVDRLAYRAAVRRRVGHD